MRRLGSVGVTNLTEINNETHMMRQSLKTLVSLLTIKDAPVEAYILSIYFLSYIKKVVELFVFIYRAHIQPKNVNYQSHILGQENVVDEEELVQSTAGLNNRDAWKKITEAVMDVRPKRLYAETCERVWRVRRQEINRRKMLAEIANQTQSLPPKDLEC